MTDQQQPDTTVTAILAKSHRVSDGDGVDRYLRDVRGITRRPLPDTICTRRHKRHLGGEMVAVAYGYETNQPIAVQRTAVALVSSPEDKRFDAVRKNGRKQVRTNGRISHGLVVFQGADEGTVVITEGVEDGLSIWQACDRTVGVTCGVQYIGGVGGAVIRNGEIIIAADNDPSDSAAAATLSRGIGTLQKEGVRVLVARPPEGVKDFNDLLRQQGDDAVRAAIDGATEAPRCAATSSGWPDGVNRIGEPYPTYGNTAAALSRLGLEFHYDVFRRKRFVAGLPDARMDGALSDEAVAKIRRLIYENFNFYPHKEQSREAVEGCCDDNARNPIVERLEALPAHDGTPRLDMWLHTYCGAPDTPLDQAYSRKFWLGMLQRLTEPGSKFDHELHLQGRQGVGKQKICEDLALFPDLCTDAGEVGGSIKEIREVTEGKQIVEHPEGAGHSRADRDRVKASVTRRRHHARMAYDRYASEVPRTDVTIRTLNEGGYLTDATGERRYWNVVVTKYEQEAFRRDKDQLYAEALALLREGKERPWLDTPDLEALHDARVRTLKAPNEYVELLADLKGCVWPDGVERVGNDAVDAHIFGHDHARGSTLKINGYRRCINEAMAELGWTKSQGTMRIRPDSLGPPARGYWRATTAPPSGPLPAVPF